MLIYNCSLIACVGFITALGPGMTFLVSFRAERGIVFQTFYVGLGSVTVYFLCLVGIIFTVLHRYARENQKLALRRTRVTGSLRPHACCSIFVMLTCKKECRGKQDL
jgi:hypothetical protein